MANIILTHTSYNNWEVLSFKSTSASNQQQHDWWSNQIKQYLQDSRATAIIWMRIEWALESNANSTTIIRLSCKWNLFSTYGKVQPGSAYSVAVINLLAASRGDQSPLKWWSHLSFSDRDGTTSSRVSNLSNQRGKRTASKPSLWHAPCRPQANVRGRRTTG